MIRWIPCELHTHTTNSDGSWTLKELCREAKKLGLECIALTDHNTISGHQEIPEASIETGIQVVPGMEWTTFYGHMLAMCVRDYVDWRFITQDGIDEGIAAIHKAGGLAGIAHPYRPGSPICTGCHWDYKIKNWNAVDYIEVWSETFPSVDPVNERAMELWTQCLNQGLKCTATSGKDWHCPQNNDLPYAVTYLGIDDKYVSDAEAGVRDALSAHRAVLTLGPLMLFSIASTSATDCGKKYGIGSTIRSSKGRTLKAEMQIDFEARKKLWSLDSPDMKVVLFSNKGKLAELKMTEGDTILSCDLQADGLTWIFPRLYGNMQNEYAEIAFTNPIFIANECSLY